jgi:putative peptidoglycan lipid II flippase
MSSGVAQGEKRAPDPMVASDTSTARSSVVVSIGFLLSGIFGALLAFFIAVIIGEGDETDGFLAAYAVYLTFVLFGSTLRVALVPLLGPTASGPQFRQTAATSVQRLLAVAGIAALALVVTAPLVGRVLVPGAPDDAKSAAALAIAILAVAAYCQIWAALLSAVLGAVRRFASSAVIYTAASAVAVGLAVLLMALGGIWGAAVGVLGGALALLAGHIAYLQRFDFFVRPALRPAARRETWKLAALAAGGAAVPVCFQLDVTISLATISDQANAVTAFSYAYFLTVLLTSVTGGVIGLVTMPDLIAALRTRGRQTMHEYFRAMAPFAVFLYLPLAAGYAVFGRPVLDALLEGPLTRETVDLLWDVSRILLAMGLAWCLFVPVTTIALSLEMFRALALVAMCMVAVHAALVIPAGTSGPVTVAAAHALSGTLVMFAVLVVVFRGESLRAAAAATAASLPAAGLALVFPALGAAGLGDSVAGACAGLVLGAAIYLALAVALWPSVGRQAVRLLKRRAAV